jgi:molecular chaperone GrpE
MTEQDHNANTIDNLAPASTEPTEITDDQSGSAGEDLKRSLEAKDAECRNAHDKYLRLAAEFDNYKRLSQRDQRDQIKFGNEHLLKELLPVVDNLERAIKSAKDNGGSDALIQGVELTLKQFVGTLTKFGVTPVESVGRPFDPTTQQAVAQVESDMVPEHSVVEEFQKGYLLHDRILRAAMVSVSKGVSADA